MSTVPEIRAAIEKLSPEERALLLDQVWRVREETPYASDEDSLPDDPSVIEELMRRKAAFDKNPESGIPWSEVKKQLRRKHG
jgi:putative addiction module component (TIGR02574 family)